MKISLNVGNINVCAAMPASSRNLIKSNCCLQRGRNFCSGMKAIIFLVTAFKEASEELGELSKEQVEMRWSPHFISNNFSGMKISHFTKHLAYPVLGKICR